MLKQTTKLVGLAVLMPPVLFYSEAAFATTQKEIIVACELNPKCKAVFAGDDLVVTVGGRVIICPVRGPCEVVIKRVGGKTKSVSSAVINKLVTGQAQ